MMKKMKNQNKILLSAVALLMVLAVAVPQSLAYFTTYVKAKGGYPISFHTTTTVEEEVVDMTKLISLANTGENDCYVRVKVFAGNQMEINYTTESGKWTLESDGYWYYSDIIAPGQSTDVLKAKIVIPDGFEESFNVIVVQESTEVLYDEAGSPYADWTRLADSKTDIKSVSREEAGE